MTTITTVTARPKNDWRVFAVVLMIIAVISALAGWGFGVITGWHPVITGLIVLALYGWVCLYEQQTVINNITSELTGLAIVTFAEVVVLIVAAVVTAVIWLLSLIPQYFFGWTFPYGQTIFIVWGVLSAVLWLLDKVAPDPNIETDFI